MEKMAKCDQKCEVYSRVVGYYRPVTDWNVGKREEFNDRRAYKPSIRQLLEEYSTKPECEKV
jgi:Anaerobic ribonucleoside-triphosphate reductase